MSIVFFMETSDEIKVQITGHFEGKYRPETRIDPAEYPDFVIESVVGPSGREIELSTDDEIRAGEMAWEER